MFTPTLIISVHSVVTLSDILRSSSHIPSDVGLGLYCSSKTQIMKNVATFTIGAVLQYSNVLSIVNILGISSIGAKTVFSGKASHAGLLGSG